MTPYQDKKCKNDTLVLDGDDCITKALDFLLKFEAEPRKTFITQIVEYNLQLHAHNGSGFVTWIILNNLPCDEHLVEFTEKGNGIISMKNFNGYIQNNKKQIPQ